MVYRNHLVNKIGLDRERYHFIRSILGPIMRGEPYVYMDEMSLNSFMTKKKAWSLEETPVVSAVNSGSRLKQTIYGSIGNIFKTAILDYRYECTNAIDFLAYLKMLKAKTEEVTDQKLHIILDQHAAHRSVKYGSKTYLYEHFHVHFMVPGTPAINAIEHFW